MGRTLIAAAPARRQPSLPGAHRTVAPPIVRPAAAVDAGARHLVAKRGRLEGQREGRLSPLRIRLLHEDVEAADACWLAIGGGVATVRAFLEAGLIDEMHLAISPVLLGSG